MSDNAAVTIEQLCKTFDGREVIRMCSMTVQRGTLYGFLGANGAGKTTLFKIMAGLLSPTMGKVRVLGKDMQHDRDTLLKKIGTLIETPVFYEHLSAADNLDIHLAYMGQRGADAGAALNRVGLAGTGRLPVSKFSLGMRQRLAIARALIHEPELLLLDEPVNGLDPMGIREIRELLRELVRNQGMTIMMSSHLLSEVQHVADTIGVIADGTIIREVSLIDIQKESPNGLEDYFMSLMAGRNRHDFAY